MKSRSTLEQGIVVCVLCLFALAASGTAAEKTLKEKIDEIVRAEVKHDLFSGTVLVAEYGKIIYSGAFGYADRDHMVPNKLETRYNIGSIGKTFTATLVMQLVQEGKIDLEDSLSMYLPDFPHWERDKIKIKHLLNHSSGLGNYMAHEKYDMGWHSIRSIEDALELIYDQDLLFEPGTRYRYSNSGMVVLGAVIEKVTGKSYKDYLTERILEPLGMSESGIVYPEDIVPNRAIGYSHTGEYYRSEVLREMPALSDGGLRTTVNDMLKYDQALCGEELLSGKYKEIMWTPIEPSRPYAFGWEVVPIEGGTVIRHGGGLPGFNAAFRRYPEQGYTIIVLANYNGDPANELADKIKAALFGQPYALATAADRDYRCGMYYQMEENYEKALEYFSKNIGGDEPHLPSLYQSARTKILGEFDQEKAIEELDRYIKFADENTRPSIAAAWWRKGVAHEQLGNTKKAVRCYEKSLELEPDFELAKESLEKIKGQK
jgi:CubicO group peptidase (beta-lactamase class C family)